MTRVIIIFRRDMLRRHILMDILQPFVKTKSSIEITCHKCISFMFSLSFRSAWDHRQFVVGIVFRCLSFFVLAIALSDYIRSTCMNLIVPLVSVSPLISSRLFVIYLLFNIYTKNGEMFEKKLHRININCYNEHLVKQIWYNNDTFFWVSV